MKRVQSASSLENREERRREEIEQNGLGSPPAGEDRTFLPHYRATRSTCVNESGADGKVKM